MAKILPRMTKAVKNWINFATLGVKKMKMAHGENSSMDDESGEKLDKFRNRFEINRLNKTIFVFNSSLK